LYYNLVIIISLIIPLKKTRKLVSKRFSTTKTKPKLKPTLKKIVKIETSSNKDIVSHSSVTYT